MLKGVRKRALRIRELAREFDVPIVEEPPLARALYASVDEQEQIPNELYQAVATILAEIYRQQGSRL
jgi:flagellar biosynthetic protein FlhB